MQTFEQIIVILKQAFSQAEEAKAAFMTVYPDLEQCISNLNAGGTVSENASDLIKMAMGDATPKDLEDAKKLIMATGLTAFTTKVILEGALSNVQSCIIQMDAASSNIQTYIRKIQ